MKSLLTVTVILYAGVISSYAQTKRDKALARMVDAELSAHFKSTEPGGTVLIARGGTIVYQRAFGRADLELSVPMKPDMTFRIGSITKQFTAVAILQLIEQGKLSLTDSIQKFIKDFPAKGNTITIEHLLTHTSGIVEYTTMDVPDPFIRRRDLAPEEIISLFKDQPLEFQPGSKFKYSNSGYFLLGYIIEEITNTTYQDYLHEKIISPLGLTNTYYDDMERVIPNRVKGYIRNEDAFENVEFQSPTIPYSAGSIISNNLDLYKWKRALLNYTLLKKETLGKAFTPSKLNDGTDTSYGLGWFILDMGGSKSIQHGGNINGFRSNVIYFPEEDVFVSTLFNCECAPMEELSEYIAYIAIGKTPPGKKAFAIEESVLDTYVGKYVFSGDTKRPLIISKENGSLFAGVPNEWKAELIPLSKTRFDVKNIRPSGTIEFYADMNGRIIRVVSIQAGKKYEGVRSE